ncbi:MAG TPA: hypothetical protein DD723_06925 [Candidatus Omnitrophica bacterium]|uniref:Glycosyltransferase RgtA/B/C/D-like domain-containing protein n=1 Tax=Candidatus Kaiserbacteria bacterium GW2011_GWA2_49_19 TaxID=1618669 RepID=A0A0G1VRL0_9BACT|nr:MAG: hypothetical protein UY44_C0006G0025 [Candidatus Kaiserbacteria bacterium GW2011_GWA2_49_19]OGX21720.1 MAG: hypothetical protein A2Y04_06195 [Omnitrophica WOR_2 bacterium GWC2_45_7]HBR15257.1 hypothetical protein [Candidatus Omnitrophota bacterium]
MTITTNKKTSFIFWTLGVFIAVLYFSLILYGPACVKILYDQGNFSVLNKLSGANQIQSLDYYLGTAQEHWIGPIAGVLSALLFIPLSLIYLPNASAVRFGLAIFIFLVVTKFNVLFYPPWGDHAGGSWAEAVWLARNHHDYIGLFHQNNSINGGPKFFFFSIYPGFYALLMRLIHPVQAFLIVSHLTVFAFSATIVALFRKIISRIFTSAAATLSALLLLSLPLYQSQTEIFNPEIPCLFFGMFCAYYLIEKKILRATGFAVLGVLIKGNGSLFCAAVFFTTLLNLIFSRPRRQQFPSFLWGCLALLAAAAQVYLRNHFIHDMDMGHNRVAFLSGWHHVVHSTFIFKFFVFSLCVLAGLYLKHTLFTKRSPENPSFFSLYHTPLVLFLCAGLWHAQHLNVAVMGPRYQLLLAPFLLFCVLFAVDRLIPFHRLFSAALIPAILISYFSSYGFLYPSRVESKYYAYGFLERSLEYRNDLLLHRRLARDFEEHYPGTTIGAPFITAHYLAFPEFGYVTKPLDVVLYGMNITFGGIRNYPGLDNLNIAKTIWIGFKSDYPDPIQYPINPLDKIIQVVEVGDKKATLFMGGIAIEKMWRIVKWNNAQRQEKNKNGASPFRIKPQP